MSGLGWDEECRGWSGTWGGRIREAAPGCWRLAAAGSDLSLYTIFFVDLSQEIAVRRESKEDSSTRARTDPGGDFFSPRHDLVVSRRSRDQK